MLRRLHIDNYKSLVNFDLELGRTHLLLGRNGTGKSAVFTVLSRLKRFILGLDEAPELFPADTLTRWERRTRQTFELEVELLGGVLQYRLELEHDSGLEPPEVFLETLTIDGKPLLRRNQDVGRMFAPDGTERREELILPTPRSILASLGGRLTSPQLDAFVTWFAHSHFLALVPSAMQARTIREEHSLAPDARNFASWYRHLAQEQPDSARSLEDELRQLFGAEFRNLRLAHLDSERGSTRELRTDWRTDPARNESRYELRFDELSDGQRALICLYTLLYADSDRPALLCIDEPDNFVALSEIQPWLSALSERPGLQTLLISHHPQIIDLSAEEALYFYRRGQGPTRVKTFQELVHPDESLTAAELVARGWLDADS